MATNSLLYTRANHGVQAPLVTVESHISSGLPALAIVGLAETAVKESRHRVRSALMESLFHFPIARITINLAPADLRKEGSRFDLPIALSLLMASKQLASNQLSDFEFAGELSLTGSIRPVSDILPLAIACKTAGRRLMVHQDNAAQAALVSGLTIVAVDHLLDAYRYFNRTQVIPNYKKITPNQQMTYPDFSEVKGQAAAKRAFEIAAAGQHNLLMVGPPGTGKSMLASCMPGILPPMTEAEAIDTAAIHSISHSGFSIKDWQLRPFRSPHHTASAVALVGGGNPPQPGEISLAHNGILFLDELPEFNRSVIETLREPIEKGTVAISRAGYQALFPSRFQLLAAMNPCPCGYYGCANAQCRCTSDQVERYINRISGPILDRIHIHIDMPTIRFTDPAHQEQSETSAVIKKRVITCWQHQLQRSQCCNATLDNEQLLAVCQLSDQATQFFRHAADQYRLSIRAFYNSLRVARTIADLANSDNVKKQHLAEALSYRFK